MELNEYAVARLAASERELVKLRRRFSEFFEAAEEFFADPKCKVQGVSIKQSDPDLIAVKFGTVAIRLRLELSSEGNERFGRVVVFLDEPAFGVFPRRLDEFRFTANGTIADTAIDGLEAQMQTNAVDVVASLLNSALVAGVPIAA